MRKLLNIDANAKTIKGQKKGYKTAILYLAPHTSSGYQTCPKASQGCAAACLNTAGRGRFAKTQEARVRKTRWFFNDRSGFMTQLDSEIAAHVARCEREGFTPCVRLNGTSDIKWENIPVGGYRNLMEKYPDVQFYDYTKIPIRRTPSNYHVTFSLAEDNDSDAFRALESGLNVSVVFRHAPPKRYIGLPVVDGDETDLRFLDPHQAIIGLKAKGDAKHDTSGFVR